MAGEFRNFSELQAAMSPRAVARARSKARRIIAGMFIAELRGHAGLTQAQLAHRVGVKQPIIGRMEMQDDVKLSTLQAIVAALGGAMRIHVRLPGGELELPAAAYQPRRSRKKSRRSRKREPGRRAAA